MTIATVQTGLTPNGVLGGTITDREFLTRLADRGVIVHVITQEGESVVKHPNFVHHFWRPRFRTAFAPLINSIPYAGNFDVWRDLPRLLDEIGPVDWVRFNSPWHVGAGTVAGCNGHRVWGTYLHCEDRPVWKWVDSWLPARCDLITCLSDDTRDDVIRRCPRTDHDRITVVPLGIDLTRCDAGHNRRNAIRERFAISPDEIVILFIGLLTPRKGIKDLVAAWRGLGSRKGIRLVVVGRQEDSYETGLVTQLATADRRVLYLEEMPYSEIPALFHASDIFFFPTHLEGFGLVVGEAMACGLPVVTTRAKGVRSVVRDKETALMSDVGDVTSMTSHLELLIGNGDERRRLGQGGRARIANHFSWDTIIDSLIKTLSR